MIFVYALLSSIIHVRACKRFFEPETGSRRVRIQLRMKEKEANYAQLVVQT